MVLRYTSNCCFLIAFRDCCANSPCTTRPARSLALPASNPAHPCVPVYTPERFHTRAAYAYDRRTRARSLLHFHREHAPLISSSPVLRCSNRYSSSPICSRQPSSLLAGAFTGTSGSPRVLRNPQPLPLLDSRCAGSKL